MSKRVDVNGRSSLMHASDERAPRSRPSYCWRQGHLSTPRTPAGRTATDGSVHEGRSSTSCVRCSMRGGSTWTSVAAMGETALILAASGRAHGHGIPILLEHRCRPEDLGPRQEDGADVGRRPAVPPGRRSRSRSSGHWLLPAQSRTRWTSSGGTALMWAVKGDLSSSVRPAVLQALLDNGVGRRTFATDRGETALFGLVRYIDDALDLDEGAGVRRACFLRPAPIRTPETRKRRRHWAIVSPGNPLVIKAPEEVGLKK